LHRNLFSDFRIFLISFLWEKRERICRLLHEFLSLSFSTLVCISFRQKNHSSFLERRPASSFPYSPDLSLSFLWDFASLFQSLDGLTVFLHFLSTYLNGLCLFFFLHNKNQNPVVVDVLLVRVMW
jgi:hypothetical protein